MSKYIHRKVVIDINHYYNSTYWNSTARYDFAAWLLPNEELEFSKPDFVACKTWRKIGVFNVSDFPESGKIRVARPVFPLCASNKSTRKVFMRYVPVLAACLFALQACISVCPLRPKLREAREARDRFDREVSALAAASDSALWAGDVTTSRLLDAKGRAAQDSVSLYLRLLDELEAQMAADPACDRNPMID